MLVFLDAVTVPCSPVAGPLAGVWTLSLMEVGVSSPPSDFLLLRWDVYVSKRKGGCPEAWVRISVRRDRLLREETGNLALRPQDLFPLHFS